MPTFVAYVPRRHRHLSGAQRRTRVIIIVCVTVITLGIVTIVNHFAGPASPPTPAPSTPAGATP